ncbi:MAG TPA: YciI family protein [Vicinamibacterales bacterium]|nr:YciI family protein [Vicinamibacterales bacterium]
MRFMVIVKADKTTEAGQLPSVRDLEVMGKFNEELIKAGTLVDAAGLQASSKGARVAFRNGKVQVTDGPFAETKELIAGYWIIDVKSKAEAIDWAKRAPFTHLPHDGREPELEIRQMFETADFPDAPVSVIEQEKSFRK